MIASKFACVGLSTRLLPNTETDDAILVANKNKVSEVKQIIEKLKKDGKHLYL